MKPKNWEEVEKLSKKPIKEILDNYEEQTTNQEKSEDEI